MYVFSDSSFIPGCIKVVIHHNSTSDDILKACFQAEIIMYALDCLHNVRVSLGYT